MTADGTILVWGAGAIGGTVGAYLIRAGHAVLFVDVDTDHVAAINARGLAIEGPVEAFAVPARAVLPGAVEGVFDRVFLCVKAQHTRAAAEALHPHLAPGGYVLSLQNGLNEIEIAEVVGAPRTMGAFVNFGADYLSPGVIQFGGRGAVVLGEMDGARTDRLRALHETMRAFDPDTETTGNIAGYLWGKLGYGAILFGTALTNDSICDALAEPAYRPLLSALAAEAVAVADRMGVQPLGFNGYDPAAFRPGAVPAARDLSFDAMAAHNARSAKTHSGIWRDLAVRRRRTEADAQLGPVVTFGAAHGVPTPAMAGLIAMVHEIEDGARPQDRANVAELSGKVLAG